MNVHQFVEIYSNDEMDSTLAAVVSTVKGCRSRIAAHWPLQRPAPTQTFLILAHVDFMNELDLQCAVSFLSMSRSAERFPVVVLIASNLSDDSDSISKQKKLLDLGVLEILERPLNLQRLRYVIESQKINFEFWSKQQPAATQSESSPTDHALHQQLIKIAAVDTNVMFLGETGVGKTYWAEYVHKKSARAKHPFMVVNCANFTPTLVESQLFGHKKGAFTGADQNQIGQFEYAAGGTIFLDEVDTLSLEVQAKLLRVVENREFRRLGENKPIPMTARIISASNNNLERLIASKEFRADLFYRLNAYEILIPPLCKRKSEIESLSHVFADEFAAANGTPVKSFDQDVLRMLELYPWPGNLRELRNCMQHGSIDAESTIIRSKNLPRRIQDYFENREVGNSSDPAASSKLAEHHLSNPTAYHEIRRLVTALENNDYNRSKTAEQLGVSRMTIYNMLKRHQLG